MGGGVTVTVAEAAAEPELTAVAVILTIRLLVKEVVGDV